MEKNSLIHINKLTVVFILVYHICVPIQINAQDGWELSIQDFLKKNWNIGINQKVY